MMKFFHHFATALGVAAALSMGACADRVPPAATSRTSSVYPGYGVVQSVELVRVDSSGIAGTGIDAGTVAGAVVGGIVGNQIGSGSGKTSATVLGAAGDRDRIESGMVQCY